MTPTTRHPYREAIDACRAIAEHMLADDVLKVPIGILAEALEIRLAREPVAAPRRRRAAKVPAASSPTTPRRVVA